jgi:hypothetical protein
VRVRNEDVYANLGNILDAIADIVRRRCPLHRPSGGPPPPRAARGRIDYGAKRASRWGRGEKHLFSRFDGGALEGGFEVFQQL